MNEHMQESPNNTLYYVIGAVALIAIVVGGYFALPKTPTTSPTPESPQAMETPVATPTLGAITKLACDTQYYNPVIGFEKYYLSVEGSDTAGASEVTCTTTVTQNNKVVSTEEVSVPLKANATRGGLEFKCSSAALELKHSIPTKVDVALKDDAGAKATCSALFALPKP